MAYTNIKQKIEELGLPERIKIELLESINEDAKTYLKEVKNGLIGDSLSHDEVIEKAKDALEIEQQEERQKHIEEHTSGQIDLQKMIEESNIRN